MGAGTNARVSSEAETAGPAVRKLMDVRCSRCGTEYDFDDTLVSSRGTRVQCTQCRLEFTVYPKRPSQVQEQWLVTGAPGAGPLRKYTSLGELQLAIRRGEVKPNDWISRGASAARQLASIAELELFFPSRGAASSSLPSSVREPLETFDPARHSRKFVAPSPARGPSGTQLSLTPHLELPQRPPRIVSALSVAAGVSVGPISVDAVASAPRTLPSPLPPPPDESLPLELEAPRVELEAPRVDIVPAGPPVTETLASAVDTPVDTSSESDPAPASGHRGRSSWVSRLFRFFTVLLAVAGAGCQGRPRAESEAGPGKLTASGHIAVVDLTSGVPESTTEGGFFPPPAAQTFVGLVRSLERLKQERDVSGVFVRVGEARYGFAQAAEVGRLLGEVRGQGKPVTCHAHQVDNPTSLLLQQGCSEIWLSPAGDVSTVGIGGQLVYLKGALDRLGVEADMLAMGRYKSGAEPLTRESPSESSEQNLRETLESLRNVWLESVRAGREGERASVVDALEEGPWTPEGALAHRIVDRIGFPDEALEAAKTGAKVQESLVVFGPSAEGSRRGSMVELLRTLSGADRRSGGRPRLAVVPLVGSITMSAEGPFAGGGITARATVRTLSRLRKDPAVRAVVIRMDSPGGSPLASDLIWRELMLMRNEKPVVASVGAMAASGGYYIVSGTSKIIAERSSIVGSIGVFGGKIVLGKALEEVGVNTFIVPASPRPGAAERAGYLSPFLAWDEPTREKVRGQMESIYELFLSRVAEGRGIDVEAVRRTAEGAIFTAELGRERGLVDEVGGLSRAIVLARELGKLSEDTPIVVEGPADNLLEMLFLNEGAEASEVEEALLRFRERQARQLASSSLPKALPWESLRPFAAALAPLLAGENVVAALPYVLDVR